MQIQSNHEKLTVKKHQEIVDLMKRQAELMESYSGQVQDANRHIQLKHAFRMLLLILLMGLYGLYSHYNGVLGWGYVNLYCMILLGVIILWKQASNPVKTQNEKLERIKKLNIELNDIIKSIEKFDVDKLSNI